MGNTNSIDSMINPGGGVPTGSGPGGDPGIGSVPGTSVGSLPGDGQGSGSVPGTGCTPGGGDPTIFSAAAIRALGAKIESLEPMLEKVESTLEETDVESESWSSKGIAIANVYPGAVDFIKNDLKTKTEQLREISDMLKGTAATWEKAEQASTVQAS